MLPHGTNRLRLSASAGLISVALLAMCQAYSDSSAPPFYGPSTNLLVVMDAQGKLTPVKNAADWQRRREHILANMQLVMGPAPEKWRTVPLDLQVLETVELPKFTRQKITFRAEPEDRVTAYLLRPFRDYSPKGPASAAVPGQNRAAPAKRPAILCLHQTTAIGKEEPAGLGKNLDLRHAQELAERGYVTLAPDYWDFGDYRHKKYDPIDAGYLSGTMKGIWNHIRSVDLLQSLPEVDGERIGCIGHSLGGHNTLWVGAFDSRVKALVCSCGFNTFASYAASTYGGGTLKNWAQRRYMPVIASKYGNDPKQIPFDWPEVLALLAPRPVFINAPLNDLNFVVEGVRDCVQAALPVYEWMGAKDHLQVVHPATGHSFPPEVRQAAYAFLDQALR